MTCPNVNTQEWKELEKKVGRVEAYRLWSQQGDIPDLLKVGDTIKGHKHFPVVLAALRAMPASQPVDAIALDDTHKAMVTDIVGTRVMTAGELIDELQGYVATTVGKQVGGAVTKIGSQWRVSWPAGVTRVFNDEVQARQAAKTDDTYRVFLADKQIGSFKVDNDTITEYTGGRRTLLAAGYRLLDKVKSLFYLDNGVRRQAPRPAFFTKTVTDEQTLDELRRILADSGITLASIDHWQQVTGKTAPQQVAALADLGNKMVAVKEGRLDADVLSEEVGHILVGTLSEETLAPMLDLVEQTQDWQDMGEDYTKAYEGDVRKAKIEMLGRIAGRYLIKQIQSNDTSSAFARLMAALRRAWRSFVAAFNPSQRLDAFFDTLAAQTVQQGIPAINMPADIFYHIDTLDYKENFDSIIESLEQRVGALRRRNNRVSINEQIDRLKEEVAELKELRSTDSYAVGYVRFIDYMLEDINAALEFIQNVRLGRERVTPAQLMQLADFIAYYEPYIDNLEKFLSWSMGTAIFTDDQVDMLARMIRDRIKPAFSSIRHFRDIKREEEFIRLVKEGWAEELGISISDPDFIEKVKAATGGYDLSDAARRLHSEGNVIQWWFGSLRDAGDQLLKLIYAKIMRIDQQVEMATLELAKQVTQKAQELGITNQDKILEREQGKRTGFYIEKTRRRAWANAKDKFFYALRERYGIPHEMENRTLFMQEWKDQVAVFPDGDAAARYKAYSKEVRDWFKMNVVNKTDEEIERIIAERSAMLSRDKYEEWRKRNLIEVMDESGATYYVHSGELVEPSDGRAVTISGVRRSTVNWLNPDYAALSDNEKAFADYIVEKKRKIDAMLPGVYDAYQAPQLDSNTADILRRKADRNVGRRLRDNFVDEITARNAEDDAIFGEKTLLRPDGSKAKYVPIYYTKLLGEREMTFEDRLNETDKLSTDVINGLVQYHRMAMSWDKMSKIAPELELIAEQAGKREFQRKNGERIAGSETAVQKQIRTFIDMQVYGMKTVGGENSLFEIPKNSFTTALGLADKKLSLPKVFRQLANYVRANNLGLNFFTTASNFIQSHVFQRIEDLVGQYTSKRAAAWAEGIFWKNIGGVIAETGNLVKYNKMYLVMEKMGLQGDAAGLFANTNMERLTRRAVETGLYFSYELIEFWRNSRVALAVMYNYRKAADGKWYNEKDYKRAYPGGDFSSLPNLYEMSSVENGRIVMPISDNEFMKLASRTKFVSQAIDGKLDKLDYAAAHQHFVAQLMTIHRGWLIQGLQRRLKKKGINVMTGDVEEGYWLTAAGFMKRTFMHPGRMAFIRQGIEEWHNLSPMERENMMRMIWEMTFATVAMVMAVILNGLADDDDDYNKDVLAYMSNRALMELGAFTPMLFATEIASTLANPIVPMRHIELMFDVNDMFFGGEVIDRGQWEGFTKRERAFYRLIPGVKGVALLRDPSAANQFLKNKPLRSVPYNLYGE